MSTPMQATHSPIDGSVYVKRPLTVEAQVPGVVEAAHRAFESWRRVPVEKRVKICLDMVNALVAKKEEIGKEITMQMGRPIRYSANEVNGFAERARFMSSIAVETLQDKKIVDPAKPQFTRYIKREPVGVVLIIPAWNYPLLTAVNGVAPAILAGNSVILKHSKHTPLCGERILEAFKEAGLPENVLQVVHTDHSVTHTIIRHPLVQFVNFTGSVPAGKAIQESAATKFMGCGLELGGNDPAYVRPDCDLDNAVENLVDGAMFNSGQCCCGIQRIYVHEKVYDEFVKKAVDLTNKYVLGSPLDPNTTLGPLIRPSAAVDVRKDVEDAISKGAKALIDTSKFTADDGKGAYMAPQILVNVNHTMNIMRDESFGPVVGIMKVESDEKAIELMNKSPYGLTAAIWTNDQEAAARIGDEIETGTVFMNRCDYVDPALAWTGVKNTGMGCTLSEYGLLQLTRPKSYHFKKLH